MQMFEELHEAREPQFGHPLYTKCLVSIEKNPVTPKKQTLRSYKSL